MSETYSTPATDQGKVGFITGKRNFFLNPLINCQNDCVWSAGKKCDIDEICLVVERFKFAKCVTVSASVCYGDMGR